jgi:hypothetical protein
VTTTLAIRLGRLWWKRNDEMQTDADNRDVEASAGRNKDGVGAEARPIEHEYQVASTVKFSWLAAYFLFSLLLTVFNKLVLGVVVWPDRLLPRLIVLTVAAVSFPMAAHVPSHHLLVSRHTRAPQMRLLRTVPAGLAGNVGAFQILSSLHRQHCYIKSIPVSYIVTVEILPPELAMTSYSFLSTN